MLDECDDPKELRSYIHRNSHTDKEKLELITRIEEMEKEAGCGCSKNNPRITDDLMFCNHLNRKNIGYLTNLFPSGDFPLSINEKSILSIGIKKDEIDTELHSMRPSAIDLERNWRFKLIEYEKRPFKSFK